MNHWLTAPVLIPLLLSPKPLVWRAARCSRDSRHLVIN